MKKIKRAKEPNLKSQVYISVGCPIGFDMLGMNMVTSFYILVQPVIGKGKTIKAKLSDSLRVQFNYNQEQGLPVEGLCKNLEEGARKIRKHYSGK